MSKETPKTKKTRPAGGPPKARAPATQRVKPGPAVDAQGEPPPALGADLALPHERDQSNRTTAVEPDPVILQAKRDLDAGLVDTDMRATPGLDAARRVKLVPGPGGKPPSSRT